MIKKAWLIAFCFVASGCGDYTGSTRAAREEFYAGKYTDAAKSLEKGAHEEGVDQLLFLFDRATALHHAGDYEESNKEFTLADKLSEIKDYTSLATEAATIITNDRIIPYKGEDFEKVLISQYMAINYLMLGKFEDALVECRRVNHKLYMMISEGKRKYRLNPFANYLSAVIYEAQGEWDHAYIDYQAAFKLLPDAQWMGEDLYRLAWKNKIQEDVIKWRDQFGFDQAQEKRIREETKLAEIVVLVENGKSPQKFAHPSWYALPQYRPRPNIVDRVDVLVVGGPELASPKPSDSHELFNVEATAIHDLDDKYAGILAKRIAGVVAKEVIADQVGRRTDPLVGGLLRLGMYMADQADLRSWLTLPRDFQIFRVRVKPGEKYTVKITPRQADGSVAPVPAMERVVDVGVSNSQDSFNRKLAPKVFVPVRVL